MWAILLYNDYCIHSWSSEENNNIVLGGNIYSELALWIFVIECKKPCHLKLYQHVHVYLICKFDLNVSNFSKMFPFNRLHFCQCCSCHNLKLSSNMKLKSDISYSVNIKYIRWLYFVIIIGYVSSFAHPVFSILDLHNYVR